jgi:hypothetical protein
MRSADPMLTVEGFAVARRNGAFTLFSCLDNRTFAVWKLVLSEISW